MKALVVGGYAISAVLYLWTWLHPSGGEKNGLLQWVSMNRLCLTEFLSVHAATLLSGFVLAGHMEGGGTGAIFWGLLGMYALFAVAAYSFHRSHRALLAFGLLLAIRAVDFLSLDLEPDVMRAEVLKNFLMSMPMMLLVVAVSMTGDDHFSPWQDKFLEAGTLWQRIVRGRPLLLVAAYYALWAFVEYKWPERIAQ